MKTITHITLLAVLLSLAGCLVVVKDETVEPVPDPRCPDAAETIAAIDAISKMSFDSDKQDAYQAIARREHLCDAPQVHLVEAVFKHLSFENSKEAVLLTLINNPEFSPAGERAILDRLHRLSFEHTKKRILDAINARHG